MAELPECLRSVRNRIRSLFGFSPNITEKNRKTGDEESGSDHDLSVAGRTGGETAQKSGSPSPNAAEKKHSNKKKPKGKSGLFNLKNTTSKTKAITKVEEKTLHVRGKQVPSHVTSSKYELDPDGVPLVNGTKAETDFLDTSNTARTRKGSNAIPAEMQQTQSERDQTAPGRTGTRQNQSMEPKKTTISSVYIREINKIKFNRPIRDSNNLPVEAKRKNGGGDKQLGAVNHNQPHSSNLPCERKTGNESTKASSSEDKKPEADQTTSKTKVPFPLPWEKLCKQSEGEVFVFKGNNTDQNDQSKSSTACLKTRPKIGLSKRNSSDASVQHPDTTETASQCDILSYPCKCVVAKNGRKEVCSLCVDPPFSSSDKVLLSKSRDINSVTKHNTRRIEASSKNTGKQHPTCSSKTQTSLSSEKSQPTPTNSTQGDRNQKLKPCKTAQKGPTKSELANASSTGVSQGGRNGKTRPHDIERNGSTTTPKSKQLLSDERKGPRESSNADSASGKSPKELTSADAKPADNNQSNKLEKLKNIWKQIKGAKEKPFTDGCGNMLFDLSKELANTSDPMAELFLAATAEDLDRIDGITRENRCQERKEEAGRIPLDPPPPPAKQVVQSGETGQINDRKPKRVKSRRLPPKQTEDTETDKTLTPSREEPSVKDDTSLDRSFSGSESNSKSKIKRSLSLEELKSSSQNTPSKPFAGEKVAFEYENPFEICGCIRIDDHYEPGMKAGRGHIPEIKVKHKRRGEPNKHLSSHHRPTEQDDFTDQNDYIVSDNRGGDPGLQIIEDLEKCEETPENMAELSTEKETNDVTMAGGETADPTEILPDMRHCQKIPLEVIYGKKGGEKEEEEYKPRSAKKKKGRQRERRKQAPPIVGMKIGF